MANAREILSRMKSVQDTRKITNAMYLISSTKLKKSKKLLEETEPYFYSLQDLIRRILRHMPDVEHFYFNPRKEIKEEDRVKGLIVITGDKGLAGAYNHNVLKMAQEWMEQSKNHRLYVVGELGRHYFEARHIQVEEQFHYTVQNPTMHRARLISSTILEDYEEGRLDEVWIIYTQMINSMQMEAEMTELLPLKREDFSNIVIPADIIHDLCSYLPGHPHPGGDTDGAFPQRRHGPCGPQLCDRIHIRRPGGVLLQRAERQDDGHAVCQRQCQRNFK